jgi:integrase
MASLKVENNNGGIRIRIQVDGVRYALAPVYKGRFDSKRDIKAANAVANRIASDIDLGDFDPTLERYKPKRPGQQSSKRIIPSLDKLWDKFFEYKKSLGLAPSTLTIDYKNRVGNTLALLPSLELKDAVLIRDWLLNNKPASQTRKILAKLNECCQWAVESEMIPDNPFDKHTKVISAKIRKIEKEPPPDPFNREERDQIIKAFSNHSRYYVYAPLVKFLFYVGCRPCEAAGLRWEDIQENVIVFKYSYVNGIDKKGLKTESSRTIILNERVMEVLEEQRALTVCHGAHVFSGTRSTRLSWTTFNNKVWKKVLQTLPHIRYRNPYQIRHTYITLNVQSGESLTDIAHYCGNSPKIILSNYAGISRKYVPPTI